MELLDMPLHRQEFIYKSKRQYLSDRSLDNELKTIPPLKQYIYDFVLPSEWIILRCQHQTDIALEKQARGSNISSDKVHNMMDRASRVMSHYEESTSNVFDLIVALQLLTGRRQIEVMKLATILPVPGEPYLAKVKSLAKSANRDVFGENEITIPLLLSYKNINRAWELMRNKIGVMIEDIPQHEITKKFGSHCQCARNRVYGKLDGKIICHTQLRNMYAELAWEDRSLNGFLNGQGTKHHWIGQALGHELKRPDDTQLYQIISLDKKS